MGSEIDPPVFSQFVCDESVKAIQWGKVLFSGSGANNWIAKKKKKERKKNLNFYKLPHTKAYLNWIVALNVRVQT